MASYTTWNPADKDSDITLSGGNLTAAAGNSAWNSLRTIAPLGTDKYYWEVTVTALSYVMVGIGTASATLTDRIGADDYGWAHQSNTFRGHNNSFESWGTSWGAGNVMSVAVDMTAGKIWVAKDGTWMGTPAGDPAAGTNEMYSGITGTAFPMATLYGATTIIVANFGTSAFSHSVPAGFQPGVSAVDKTVSIGAIAGADIFKSPTILPVFPPAISLVDTFVTQLYGLKVIIPALASAADIFTTPGHLLTFSIPSMALTDTFRSPLFFGQNRGPYVLFPNTEHGHIKVKIQSNELNSGLYLMDMRMDMLSQILQDSDIFPNTESNHITVKIRNNTAGEALLLEYMALKLHGGLLF
jgi:hypothetical protein